MAINGYPDNEGRATALPGQQGAPGAPVCPDEAVLERKEGFSPSPTWPWGLELFLVEVIWCCREELRPELVRRYGEAGAQKYLDDLAQRRHIAAALGYPAGP